MKIDFVTLFPGMFPSVMDASMMARAKDKGLLEWSCVNPRDFTEDKHNKVDDSTATVWRIYEVDATENAIHPHQKNTVNEVVSAASTAGARITCSETAWKRGAAVSVGNWDTTGWTARSDKETNNKRNSRRTSAREPT